MWVALRRIGNGYPHWPPRSLSCFGVAKHAAGSSSRVTIRELTGRLVVQVSDDGPGGARPEGGSGLRGLADRVAAAGGVLRIESPPGSGTHLEADIPCP